MKTLILKPQHETTSIGLMLQYKSAIEYHNKNIAPRFNEMEKWEQKEYKKNLIDYTNSLEDNKKYIIENESFFNELLSQYNLSVSIFINKYILN